ncbi:MAG: ABC transporter ATP-binding protein [Calditrichia bacterium]|nr:ABC transporter ATP-binding protein [Calditrichia bacterium]
MIEIKNVTIAYENTVAVKDLSLKIEKGSLIGIVGPNGAGKSTLIKAMVGLISEYNGEIYYSDLLLQKNRYEIKKMLGYAPEDVDLLPYLTGREYLQMVADIRNISNSKIQIYNLLSLLNMDNKKNELINSYSHGMLQKLSVAAAMIGLPPVLIFDEAFNGFDPVSLFNLKAEIDQHVESGGTVIISSHILELIEKWCSQIVIMNEGKILGNFEKKKIEKMKRESGKDFNEIFISLIQKNESN